MDIKYRVKVVLEGYVEVMAETAEEALEYANNLDIEDAFEEMNESLICANTEIVNSEPLVVDKNGDVTDYVAEFRAVENVEDRKKVMRAMNEFICRTLWDESDWVRDYWVDAISSKDNLKALEIDKWYARVLDTFNYLLVHYKKFISLEDYQKWYKTRIALKEEI